MIDKIKVVIRLFVLLILFSFGTVVQAHDLDAARMLVRRPIGDQFLLSTWISPGILRTGKLEISSELVEKESGKPADCLLFAIVTPKDEMNESFESIELQLFPSLEAAHYAGEIDLPEPGLYEVLIVVKNQDGEIDGEALFQMELQRFPRLVPVSLNILLLFTIYMAGFLAVEGIRLVKNYFSS